MQAPEGTSSFGFIRFQQLLEQVLGREIDLVEYGGLTPRLDDDIRREAVLWVEHARRAGRLPGVAVPSVRTR